MNIERISQYFFIIAAVVSILDGALSLSESMNAIKFIVLILSGIVVGVLKHSQEKEFLISGVAVVITGYVLIQLLGTYFFIAGLGLMLLNFIIFLASALVVVGIHQVGGSLTFPEILKEEMSTIPEKSKSSLKKNKKNPIHMTRDELKRYTFEKLWGILILVAVAFTFIILLGEMFFEINSYQQIFNIIEICITVLFILDLFVLYEKSKNIKDFFKHNFFDIIAAIPSVGVLRGLKIIRAVKVIKSLNRGLKATKLVKMYKTSKFFSEESYFNHLDTKNTKK